MKLLKNFARHCEKPLCLIINQSLLTDIYPDKLTIAKVILLSEKTTYR